MRKGKTESNLHNVSVLNTVVCANTLDFLRSLPDGLVNCVISSPPYFRQRSYLPDSHTDKGLEIGLEDTPDAYVARLVEIFAEVRRVLRNDGVAWVNLGDSFAGSGKGRMGDGTVAAGPKQSTNAGTITGNIGKTGLSSGLKPKDLIGIPWRVAFALQADGWWLRTDIIWEKPNQFPESVRDRPTRSHEYVFLLTKSARYWYDAEAIQEEAKPGAVRFGGGHDVGKDRNDNKRHDGTQILFRNRRTVWTIPTESKLIKSSIKHFAKFPQALIEPMILAGCPQEVCAVCGAPQKRIIKREALEYNDREAAAQRERCEGVISGGTKKVTLGKTHLVSRETVGWEPTCNCGADTRPGIVLDPFMGSGTTALVAQRLNRYFLGCDLNPDYVELANKRIYYRGDDKRMLQETEQQTDPISSDADTTKFSLDWA